MSLNVSSKLDYKKLEYSYPKYKLIRRTQQSGGGQVVITPAGGQESVFEIPVNVYNFAKSYLRGSIFIDAPAVDARSNNFYNSQVSLISEMQLYNSAGVLICDAKYVNNYTDIVSKCETKFTDFLTTSGALNTSFLSRSNENKEFVPRYDNTPSSLSYTEHNYLFQGAATNANPPIGAAMNIPFLLPLESFKNTMCEFDKDVFFGETVFLRIRWASTSKIGWTSEVVHVPAAGGIPAHNIYDVSAGALPLAANVVVNNLELYLAMEEDVLIQNAIKSQYSVGITYNIPYLFSYKTSQTGTNQPITVRISPNQGRRLKRIYHAFYNPVEEAHTAYDHDNLNSDKCLEYYTTLDNVKRQDWNISPVNLDDYMINKERFKDSVIQNANIFLYNYFILDDFTESEPFSVKKNKTGVDEGLSINSILQWDMNATIPNAVPNNQLTNHYTFVVVSRNLYVGPGGMRLE